MANLTGLVPFPIVPQFFGGAERCWNVLSRLGPINVHALSWEAKFESAQIGDVNYRVSPVSPAASQRAEKMQGWGFQTYDPMPHIARADLQGFADTVKADQPDFIVLEHPWLVDFVGDVPFIYDAHNAEAFHYAQRWGAVGPEFEHIFELERRAIEQAFHVTYCSEIDLGIMRESFGDFPATHVPNGVTLPDLTDRKPGNILLFIGSQYPPNVDAANRLARMAPNLPDFRIVIAGGCSYFVQQTAPNVELLGVVDEAKLHCLFLEAFAFVNLMTVGSGTHLKIGRALSYGVPVITSEVGKRGYQTPLISPLNDISGPLDVIVGDYDLAASEALREASSLSWDEVVKPVRELIRAGG